MTQTSCLFCKIASGAIPATLVYEDDEIVAFADIHPQAPEHLLIIPRQHIGSVLEIAPEDDALIGRIHRVAARLARERGFAESGFRLLSNCNGDGGQTVFHLHYHLLGKRQLTWPPG